MKINKKIVILEKKKFEVWIFGKEYFICKI